MYTPDEKVLKEVANLLIDEKIKESEETLNPTAALTLKAMRLFLNMSFKTVLKKQNENLNIDLTLERASDDVEARGIALLHGSAVLLKHAVAELGITEDEALNAVRGLLLLLKKEN